MTKIEVNYEGIRNLQTACGDQMRTFSSMESFFTTHCGASKFSSIPVLTLFSPVYSDAAAVVTEGLGEGTKAAERFRDNVRDNRNRSHEDDVQSSTLLAKSWKVTTADYTPPAIAQGNGPVINYNVNGMGWVLAWAVMLVRHFSSMPGDRVDLTPTVPMILPAALMVGGVVCCLMAF